MFFAVFDRCFKAGFIDNIGGNKLSGNTIEARIGYRF